MDKLVFLRQLTGELNDKKNVVLAATGENEKHKRLLEEIHLEKAALLTERKSLLEALVGIKSDIEAVDEAEQQALGACAASQADQSVLISEFEAMKQGVDKVRLVLGLDKLSGSLTEELEKSRAGLLEERRKQSPATSTKKAKNH